MEPLMDLRNLLEEEVAMCNYLLIDKLKKSNRKMKHVINKKKRQHYNSDSDDSDSS